MTIKHIIEIIQQQFPELGEKQILKDLDLSQKVFCDETSILRGVEERTIIATTEGTRGLRIPLPTNCKEVKGVLFYGSNNAEIINTYSWSFDKDGIYIHSERKLASLPSSIVKIVIEFIASPTEITLMSDTLSIPEEFHYAIIADLLQRFWAYKGVLQNAGFWKAEYQRYRIQAKKQVNYSSGGNALRGEEIRL